MTIRVFIVDDHAMFRAGVISQLDLGVFEVIGEASTVQEAVSGIAQTKPQAVLLDVHLPDGSGADVIRQVQNYFAGSGTDAPHFLALSVSDSPADVGEVVRQGALGYITKTISSAELNAALTQVASGFTVFSPKLAGFILSAFAENNSNPDANLLENPSPSQSDIESIESDPEYNTLSNREREILQLIARGWSYKEIAKDRLISVKTVESHVSKVLRKLQLSNRHEITYWASKRGIV